jgi:hypothetical protein
MTERKIGPNTGNAGKGRPKGAPNKVTKALKEMILGALDDAGGQAYLVKQAEHNPAAFLTLIGKVLPMQVEGKVDGTLIVQSGVPRASDRPA